MIRPSLHRTLVPAFALSAIACSSDGSSPAGGDTDDSTVATAITDTSLTVTPSSSEAREITFEVSNDGTQMHEIEIKGDVAHDALPVENSVANTDGLELIDEVEGIAPSTTADLTVDLDPGNYVVLCNLTGHYESGLHTGFTVS